MDLVRFDSQERVDLPDMRQASFLVLGEFRRLVRTMFTGDVLGIIQGFKVTAEGGTERVVVTMDDSGTLSAAVGPENTGTQDHGQLIGGRGPTGTPEGAASQILDLTGQLTGSYTIEMRFSYVDGTADNRAFWNEVGNTEFVASTDTRHVATWTARFVPVATGGEWIPLAVVAYTSATNIVGGNITDARSFLFEGDVGAFTATEYGDGSAGGLPDFDRADTRDTVGVNTVYGVLRALGRQIQDAIGPGSDGTLGWFKRIVQPPRTSTSPSLAPETTRNFSSMDMYSQYTVGDGTTTWGDFSGQTALDDVMTHIITTVNHPKKVRIYVKTDRSDESDYPFLMTGTYDITNYDIEIINASTRVQGGLLPITGSNAAGTFTGSGCMLRMRGILWSYYVGVTTAVRGPLCNFVNGSVDLESCSLTSSSAIGLATVRCGTRGMHMRRVNFFGGSLQCAGFAGGTDYGAIMDTVTFQAGVANTQTPRLILWTDTANTSNQTVAATANWVTGKLMARGCEFYTVDAQGASGILFSNSFFRPLDEIGLTLGESGVSRSASIYVENCSFSIPNTDTGYAMQALASATYRTRCVSLKGCVFYGTGFARTNSRYLSFETVDGLSVENCRCEGILPGAGAITTTHVSLLIVGCTDVEVRKFQGPDFQTPGVNAFDAVGHTGLFINDCDRVLVHGCRFLGDSAALGVASAASFCFGIFVNGSTDTRFVTIRDNFIRGFSLGNAARAGTNAAGIKFGNSNVDQATIENNYIQGCTYGIVDIFDGDWFWMCRNRIRLCWRGIEGTGGGGTHRDYSHNVFDSVTDALIHVGGHNHVTLLGIQTPQARNIEGGAPTINVGWGSATLNSSNITWV